MAKLDEADPIWGDVPADVFEFDYGGRLVRSLRTGGAFQVGPSMLPTVRGLPVADKTKLTTWILERNRFGAEEWPAVTRDVIDQVRARHAMTAMQRVDKLLEYLSFKDFRPGNRPQWLGSHMGNADTAAARREAMAWTESASDVELNAIAQMMADKGFLRDLSGYATITADGFARMDELRKGGAPTNQVFVAMWFDQSTNSAFAEGIAPAIVEAGYRPLRIDQKEHVNKIDDEIVAEIRRSKFVVADFTCGVTTRSDGGDTVAIPRGGVYFEAGFALGLGTPVIWCVKETQINDVHFDVRQFNQIAWSDPADLKTKLFNRIRALFNDPSS